MMPLLLWVLSVSIDKQDGIVSLVSPGDEELEVPRRSLPGIRGKLDRWVGDGSEDLGVVRRKKRNAETRVRERAEVLREEGRVEVSAMPFPKDLIISYCVWGV